MTPEQDNPWLRKIGFLNPNDPMVQEWIEIMKENRRRFDEDPDAFYAYMCELKSAYDEDEEETT
jgi:hypothetical protein